MIGVLALLGLALAQTPEVPAAPADPAAQAAPATSDAAQTLADAGFAAPGIDDEPWGDPPDAATAEARTEALAKVLRCPVCQALSVADSNSDTARAMYDRIGEFVAEGYTDEQITDYFVETYGEWVRLEPRTSGANMVLWLMPAGVLVFGVLFIAVRSRPDDDAPAPRPTVATDDPYRARILAELGEPPAPEAPRDP